MSSAIQVRRFTHRGLNAIEERFLDIIAGDTADVSDLVDDQSLTELVDPPLFIEIQEFSSRRAAAEYLMKILAPLDWDAIENDAGLWTWLTVAWIDVLAPITNGTRRLGQINRWLLAPHEWKRYYRHLLAGPCYIYKAHEDDPDRADAALCSSVAKPGEVAEQVANRLDLVRSPGIMGAITALYFDRATGTLKRGAAGKERPGTSRRLGPVLKQLDRTWDIQDLASEEVLALLPSEFDQFNPLRAHPTSSV
jgi:hypothetical protein